MKRGTIILLVLILVFTFTQLVSAQDKWGEEYNQEIIDKYIESDATMGWDLKLFEIRFGSTAALCYMCGLIMLAVVLGLIITKK